MCDSENELSEFRTFYLLSIIVSLPSGFGGFEVYTLVIRVIIEESQSIRLPKVSLKSVSTIQYQIFIYLINILRINQTVKEK